MGIYLHPPAYPFEEARKGEIYVDKSMMIAQLNRLVRTPQKYVCISRPRRFGKSLTANMLCAYYDCEADGATIFHGLKIEQDDSFSKYQGKFDVIRINMQEFLSRTNTMAELLERIQKRVGTELKQAYAQIGFFGDESFAELQDQIFAQTGHQFVVIIDEWDCIFREEKNHKAEQEMYLDFLRDWLKDKSYVALAYMTGILPIKKYGTHSALNMFDEYSMTNPARFADFVGFNESEVKALCKQYQMDFEQTKEWYDGYAFSQSGHIYSPRSVVSAMLNHTFDTYWNRTETFRALKVYMDLNYDHLREKLIALMAGARQKINIGTFDNDMSTFATADDVLTLLIHLGYLAYDFETHEVYIPNHEVMLEYASAITTGGWDVIAQSVKDSDALLSAIWSGDADAVGQGIEKAHLETSHLQYNDENALSYTLSLALYAARQYYTIVREMPTGKGFADLAFLPRPRYSDKSAMVVELKWDKDAKTAIRQIQEKNYPTALQDYTGKILLVGVSYDKKTRKHQCEIETI